MTRPVKRSSLAGELEQTRKGVDSLARRPKPVTASGGGVAEWMTAVSSTNLGATITALDWTLVDGEYDTGAPTFAVNAAGNIELGADGAYMIQIQSTGWVLAAGVDSVEFLRLKWLSGATPKSAASALGAAGELANVPLRVNHAHATGTDDSDFNVFPFPEYGSLLVLSQGSIAGAGAPSELEVAAYIEEDQVGTAHSEPTFRLMIVRFGPTFV